MSEEETLWQFDIIFNSKDGFHNEGEEISGEVIIDPKEDIVVEKLSLNLSGGATVNWSGVTSASRDRQSRGQGAVDEENYLDINLVLYQREDGKESDDAEILVKKGKHSYPFKAVLPRNIPSSIKTDKGGISYLAVATLERPWLPMIVTCKPFSVRCVVDLNELPQVAKPLTAERSREVGAFCCLRGKISAFWRLEKMGFVPGEKMRIHGEIKNQSRKRILKSKAVLIQHIRYYDGHGGATNERHELTQTQIQKGEILPGHMCLWRDEMEIPPLPPTGLKGSNLIDLWYNLKLKVVPSGMTESLVEVMDIVIATVPRGSDASTVFTGFNPPPLDNNNSGLFSSPDQALVNSAAMDLSYFI